MQTTQNDRNIFSEISMDLLSLDISNVKYSVKICPLTYPLTIFVSHPLRCFTVLATNKLYNSYLPKIVERETATQIQIKLLRLRVRIVS